jgi:hypothetical protein
MEGWKQKIKIRVGRGVPEKTQSTPTLNAVTFEAKRCSFWGGMTVATDGKNLSQKELFYRVYLYLSFGCDGKYCL